MDKKIIQELKTLFDRNAQPWTESSEELLGRLAPTRRYLGPRYWLEQIARRAEQSHGH